MAKTNADKLRECGKQIQDILTAKFNGKKPTFVVIVQPQDAILNEYLSNGNRMDVIKVLRETADAMEGRQN